MPKAAAPPASEIPSYQVTDKRLRRIMAPRADGTHIVPQQILDSWKDTATAQIYLDDARATLIRQRLSPSSATLLARLRLSFLQLLLASQR